MPADLIFMDFLELTLPNSGGMTHPLPRSTFQLCIDSGSKQIYRKNFYKGIMVPLHKYQFLLLFILSQLSVIAAVLIPTGMNFKLLNVQGKGSDRNTLTSLMCLPRLMTLKGHELLFIPVGSKLFSHSWPGD